MVTNQQKLFIETLTALFQAHGSVDDLFFKNRLGEAIGSLLESYIYIKDKGGHDSHVRSCKEMSNILEAVIYIKKGNPIYLAVAHERVLYYLQSVLTIWSRKEEKILPENQNLELISIPKEEVFQEKSPRLENRKRNKSIDKILEFVKRTPEARTRDIVEQFSALSERTVKRSLKELNEEGLIVRKSDKGAVYYSAV
ncbi:MAG: DeoR family transcriptional regulator [Patescibacteria group bacterium]